MTLNVRNLDWLRKLKIEGVPDAGQRLYEMFSDVKNGVQTIEQQGNFSCTGNPAPPPQPDGLKVMPHPNGVQFSIKHDGEFYQGIQYEIDATSAGVTHTYDVGSSRNGVLPVGNLPATYQVRARYPNGQSSPAFRLSGLVSGGGGSSALLPSEGAGTTRRGQPPGFGGPFRSSNGAPPVRGQ